MVFKLFLLKHFRPILRSVDVLIYAVVKYPRSFLVVHNIYGGWIMIDHFKPSNQLFIIFIFHAVHEVWCSWLVRCLRVRACV